MTTQPALRVTLTGELPNQRIAEDRPGVVINFDALHVYVRGRVRTLRRRTGKQVFARRTEDGEWNLCTIHETPGSPEYGAVERKMLADGWQLVIGYGPTNSNNVCAQTITGV